MKLLFIGGNGNISWYCVQKALEYGDEVWEINRAKTLGTRREIQKEVHHIIGDINDLQFMRKELCGCCFDIVCDFICFDRVHAETMVRLFKDKTEHFIFISSEAVYKRAGRNLPFSECCEKIDPLKAGGYIRGKLEAEQYFYSQYEDIRFPVTVVRPAYTYDVIVPVSIGQNCFTAPEFFQKGYPALIAGDGTNLWSFTHASDFADAFVPLIHNPDTVGEDFHIATHEWLSWNEEMELLFRAMGLPEYEAVHIPYEEACKITDFQTADLMRQRMWHNIYDLSKLQTYVPHWKAQKSFEQGISETISWLMEKERRRRINMTYKSVLRRLYQKYWEGSLWTA